MGQELYDYTYLVSENRKFFFMEIILCIVQNMFVLELACETMLLLISHAEVTQIKSLVIIKNMGNRQRLSMQRDRLA